MEAIVSRRKRLYLTYGHIQPFLVFTARACQMADHSPPAPAIIYRQQTEKAKSGLEKFQQVSVDSFFVRFCQTMRSARIDFQGRFPYQFRREVC